MLSLVKTYGWPSRTSSASICTVFSRPELYVKVIARLCVSSRAVILPALSIVLASMGFWALGMRGMMVTNEGEDYMILARAKGLSPGRVFLRYAVRNSLLPQVTALGLTLGSIVGGATLVEYLFAYPGVGYLLYQAIVNNDFTLIQGIVFILILTTSTAVLIIDLTYPLIDPRISYQQR